MLGIRAKLSENLACTFTAACMIMATANFFHPLLRWASVKPVLSNEMFGRHANRRAPNIEAYKMALLVKGVIVQ